LNIQGAEIQQGGSRQQVASNKGIYMNVIHHQFDKPGGEHLSDTELFELQQGLLPPARQASVQQHLFVCLECLQAFKDVSDFLTPLQADETVPSKKQIEAGWQELKKRLPLSEVGVHPARAAARTTHALKLLPLAAGLLVTLGLAGLFIWRERQTETQLAQTANTPSQLPTPTSPAASAGPTETALDQRKVVGRAKLETPQAQRQNQATQSPFSTRELFVTSSERAATEVAQPQPLFVPAQAKAFTVKLRIYNPIDYRSFSVELLDRQRKVVQTAEGKVTKDLAVEAVFERAGLADGQYFLRVTGSHKENKSVEPLESAIEITARSK